MTHSERHEEIILNHIDGSLDDRNLDEALGLLRQCKECKEIYDASLALRSESHRSSLLNFLSGRKAAAVEEPKSKRWKVLLWRPLLAAVLWLAAALLLGLYTHKVGMELKKQVWELQAGRERMTSELAILKQENHRLEGEVKQLEKTASASQQPPTHDSSGSAMAALEGSPKSFGNPHTFALILSEVRGQEALPARPVVEVEFPKPADLLHMTLSIAEERPHHRYSIVITYGENKTVIQRYENIKRDRFGNFNLYFPRDFFTRRDYRIKIFGFEDGQSKLLAQQRIRLKL